ncbi:hypothetical protein G5714_013169 [Onychostoma macrolepis]|uniref:non-specific serine/threonine protein kinase n=1 Tax=Onychostoma macrolepis TaxID=369639 RepID=A0A7J6CDU8_9TELE|nr:hypothetical protein G5714_013169 [Onychostoma macrolepis]
MSSRLSSISKELVQSQLNLGPQSVMEAPLEKRSTVTEKHASRRKKNTISSLFKKVRKAVKLPFCSKNTVDCLPQLDPQFDNSTPDVSLSISKDSVERLELLSLSSQDTHCLSVGTCIIKRGTVDSLERWSDADLSNSDSFREQFSFTLPESIHSRYIVKKIIGEGGYDKVAIKRIQKTIRDQYLQTAGHPKPLITEVALMLMMRQGPISPHVIQLYEWFEHPQKITLIMEYPDPCESLLDFINNNPNMNETTARLIMCQAVQAVLHCIECGVFHNDIHPENILLRKHTLELKLIDFGCGHLLSSNGYDCRQYRGIRAYFPPELFTYGKFHAVSTNVWALGVLLYEMVNTCSPFRNITEIMQAKIRFENPDLSKAPLRTELSQRARSLKNPLRRNKIKWPKANEAEEWRKLDEHLSRLLQKALRGSVVAKLNLFGEILYEECSNRYGEGDVASEAVRSHLISSKPDGGTLSRSTKELSEEAEKASHWLWLKRRDKAWGVTSK